MIEAVVLGMIGGGIAGGLGGLAFARWRIRRRLVVLPPRHRG